ncbi:hypothetical protein ACFW6F_26700 [Streptomyces sp. NPDC058746]|uniref:hypothetical protein n=1 Tax=Streptomyces sp. NPDC058746 TaxID=3346622 RepID=UPI00368ACFB2
MTGQAPYSTPSLLFEERIPVLVGSPAPVTRFTVGGADVVMGPAGMAVVVKAGDDPGRSGVWNAAEVRLLGPAPAAVTERLMGSSRADDGSLLPIHIAVDVEGDTVHLGTGRVGRGGTADGVLTDCELRLDSPLSRDLLDRVRPPLPPDDLPGLEWLRQVNGDRSAALEDFITGWYPPLTTSESDGARRATTRTAPHLPDGLRQLHRLAERRPDVLGVQNRILSETSRRTDLAGEMRVFGDECQGGFSWSLLWTLDEPEADPTVWFGEFDQEPIAEQEPLSGFLIQFSLFEACMGAKYLALPRRLDAPQVEQLAQALHPVPLRPFWPWVPTQFYVAPGLVMRVGSENGVEFDAWAGASHRSALDPLAGLPIDWLRFDG